MLKFLAELITTIRLWVSSSKARATTKALVTAAKIQRIDERLNILRSKKATKADIVRIKALEKKKLRLWDNFNYFVTIN